MRNDRCSGKHVLRRRAGAASRSVRSRRLLLLGSIAVSMMTVGCGAAASPPTAPTVQAAASELAPTVRGSGQRIGPDRGGSRGGGKPARVDSCCSPDGDSSSGGGGIVTACLRGRVGPGRVAPTVEAASSQLASAVASAQAEIAPTVEALEPTVAAIQTQVAPTVAALATSVAETVEPPIATSIAASPVEIADVQVSLDDTTVTFRSRGTQPANLSNWVLTIGTFPYVLPVNPYLRLDPNETVNLHFTRGTDTETDVYVGQAPERLVESMQPGTLFVLINHEPAVASTYRLP